MSKGAFLINFCFFSINKNIFVVNKQIAGGVIYDCLISPMDKSDSGFAEREVIIQQPDRCLFSLPPGVYPVHRHRYGGNPGL